jgi:hypothetical protein
MFGNLLKNRQQPAKRFEYTPRYYKPDENKFGMSAGEETEEGAERFRTAFKQTSATTTSRSKLLSFFVSRYMMSLFVVIIVFLVVMYKYMPAFLQWLENR